MRVVLKHEVHDDTHFMLSLPSCAWLADSGSYTSGIWWVVASFVLLFILCVAVVVYCVNHGSRLCQAVVDWISRAVAEQPRFQDAMGGESEVATRIVGFHPVPLGVNDRALPDLELEVIPELQGSSDPDMATEYEQHRKREIARRSITSPRPVGPTVPASVPLPTNPGRYIAPPLSVHGYDG
jgi:hypothetical protein